MTSPPGRPGSYGLSDPYGPGRYEYPGFRPGGRIGGFVGLAVAIVLAMGAGIGAYLLFFRDADQRAADQVVTGFAQSYTALAHSMSTADLARVQTYLCPRDQRAVQAIYRRERSTGARDVSFSMTTSGTTVAGSAGSFRMAIVDMGATHTDTGSLVRQRNTWLVCDTLSG